MTQSFVLHLPVPSHVTCNIHSYCSFVPEQNTSSAIIALKHGPQVTKIKPFQLEAIRLSYNQRSLK